MKRTLLALCAAVFFLALCATAQLTVDATGPVHKRRSEPTSGSGDGVGRKLTLQVAMAMLGSSHDENGKSLVEFVLTNSGKSDLALPISPHPGDFEPSDAKLRYTVKVLTLSVTSDKSQAKALAGQASLYGSDMVPGTLVALPPGESIRVLAKVAFPQFLGIRHGAFVFVGHAMLGNETVKTANGQTLLDVQEIGSASSLDYSASSLLGAED